MNDVVVGRLMRALRRRKGWRQADLAERARASPSLVSLVERGHLDRTSIGTIRRLFAPLEARVDVQPSWRGADLDRLLDADHAAMQAALARRLERDGWQVKIEVTYNIDRERGSVDVLALNPARRAALVAEIKSDIPAAEATARKLDEKGRLAAPIVRERAGWTPTTVGVVLVLPESPRLRRLLAGPARALAMAFPIGSRTVAKWLRDPIRPLAATWFLTISTPRAARRVSVARRVPAGGEPRESRDAMNVDLEEEIPPRRILR